MLSNLQKNELLVEKFDKTGNSKGCLFFFSGCLSTVYQAVERATKSLCMVKCINIAKFIATTGLTREGFILTPKFFLLYNLII